MAYSAISRSRGIAANEKARGKSPRILITFAALCVAFSSQAIAAGPKLQSVTLSPTHLLGGASSTGTITLDSAAPADGTAVTVSSDNAAATVPGSATVASGATKATFEVATTSVGKSTVAKISAALGSRTRHAELRIEAIRVASVVISPATVTGGTGATGTVTLNGAAPSNGAAVALASNDASTTVPSSLTVPFGASAATSAVSAQAHVRVTATLGNSKESAALLVQPSASFKVSLDPATVASGAFSTGTVTLSAAAPSGGLTAKLSSDNTAAKVEGSVRIRSGQTTGTFGVLAGSVASSTQATITVSIGGTSQTASLTVLPPALKSLSLDQAAIASGSSTQGHVKLTGRAPQGGLVIQLSSSNSAAAVPSTVTVKQGHDDAIFKVAGGSVTAAASSTITASAGTVTETATITVSPMGLSSISVYPSSVPGGHDVQGMVSLNGPAPAGGTTVSITSSDPLVTVPATVTIKEGHSKVSFKVSTSSVTLQTPVTLTATLGASTQSTTLIVNAVSLVEVGIHPSHVKGGGTSTGTIHLDGPAPAGGIVVTLSSNSQSASVPATVTVPAGQNSVAFTITTSAVTAKTNVEITATVGDLHKTQNLTITL